MKKSALIFIIMLIVLILFPSIASSSYEMPYVILGGFPIYFEFSDEAFVFTDRTEPANYTDVTKRDLNPIQIGDITITSFDDVKRAYELYQDSYVIVKQIIDHKIHESTIYIPKYDEESVAKMFSVKASIGATVCFIDSNTGIGLATAHPISSGCITGNVLNAEFKELLYNDNLPYKIKFSKTPKDNPKKIGTILGQNDLGVFFKYDLNELPDDYSIKVQIAEKSEVSLGTAYMYLDVGEGLQMYDIAVTSTYGAYKKIITPTLFDPMGDITIYASSIEDDPIISSRFTFKITDSRLIDLGITNAIGGMSGCPILQNDKLVGFVGYSYGDGGFAIYADSAYKSLSNTSRLGLNDILLSATSHPVIYPGQFPVTYCYKSFYEPIRETNKVSAISMIDPISFKYAFGFSSNDDNVFSGFTIRSSYKQEGTKKEAIGTISDNGICYYGYIEPFSYYENGLVEIAFKDEIYDGYASVYFFDGYNGASPYKIVHVKVEKQDDKLLITPLDNEDTNMLLITGAPIFQSGKMIGVTSDTTSTAYYAIDVYNEMMN